MYLPKHQAQLVAGVPTRSVDCGVRGTSVAIDRSTRGVKRPKPAQIRARGSMGIGWTNASQWLQAVESYDTRKELGGKWDRLSATKLQASTDWNQVDEFVRTNEAVVLTIDYGKLRRAAPRKTGSETFDGFHAVTIVGQKSKKPSLWRVYDSLNDGRYRGCPKGPVFISRSILKEACLEVGRKEVGSPVFWALLVDRAERLEDGVEIEPIEPESMPTSLGSVLADLYEVRDTLSDPNTIDRIQRVIDDYEIVLGISGDELETAEPGVEIIV